MEAIKRKALIINTLKYIIFFLLMIVLNNASLNSNLQPFGFAMFFALIWCNQNILLISLTYFLSNLVFGFNQVDLICCAFTILVFLFFYFLHYKLRKPLNIWLILLYSFLSQIAYMYLNINSLDSLFYCIAYLAVGLIFLLATLVFFQAISRKKFKNFTLEESVCGFVFLAILSLGLSTIEIFYINLLQILALILLLILRKISKSTMLLSAIIIGLGASLNSFYTGYLFIFCCYALIIWVFADKNPILLVLGLLFIDLFVGLYLQVIPIYHYQSLLAVLIGCIAFLLIPKKYIEFSNTYFSSSDKSNLVENVVNFNTKKLNRRLLEMSEIFSELQSLFKSLSSGNLNEEELIDTISQEIIQKTCQDCKDHNRCLRLNNRDTLHNIKNLVFMGIKKGKLTLMDVDERFSKNCIKLNALIPYLNEIIAEYKKYENNINKADTSRNVIARSFGGVSGVLQELADNINSEVRLDTQYERDLYDELVSEGIQCREILIYQKEYNTSVALLIKNENVYKNKLTNIVSNIFNMNMSIVSVTISEIPNYSNVLLKVSPRYDVIYGIASRTKYNSSSSGDTHSFNKIDNDKFLFALCDGMGSGENAKRASELSIGIIENLYKAGFKSETVIDCTNNLLTMASNDIFTALDLGVIDLKNGGCDIIKIGAPLGYIKHKDNTEIIDAGALPLGILEELRPSVSQYVLSHGDNVIMMTDGVLDAFENEEQLKIFINNMDIKNPQTLAENILNEAVLLNNDAPNDDMTVFVVRILEKK